MHKQLTHEEKLDLLIFVDDERDTILKNKIEQSESLNKTITEYKQQILALESEKNTLTDTYSDLKRQTTAENNRLDTIKGAIDTEQSKLNQLQIDIANVQSKDERDTQCRFAEKERLESEITALEGTYKRLIDTQTKALHEIVIEIGKKTADMKQLDHLEQFTKGHFIRLLQEKLTAKGIKVDVLKMLNE